MNEIYNLINENCELGSRIVGYKSEEQYATISRKNISSFLDRIADLKGKYKSLKVVQDFSDNRYVVTFTERDKTKVMYRIGLAG